MNLDFLGSIFGTTGADAERWWPLAGMAGRKTTGGTRVSPTSAMSLPTYFACIQVLAADVAKLPLKVFRENADGTKTIEKDHPAVRVLRRVPNTEMSPFTLRETLTAWAAGWGNGYAEIVRDNSGRISGLAPIHPSRVRMLRIDKRLVYEVRSDHVGMETVGLYAEEVFHLHGLGDGISGYSIAQIGAQSIGAAMAAETFGAAYYGNNTSVGGVLTHPGALSDIARKNLRESWESMHGGPDNAHKAAILEEGMTFTPTSVNPSDAQFIEGKQFDVETICRWFRMPPHKVQHLLRATFTNIEQQGIEYVTDTLMTWLVRWEQEAQRKLLADDEELYVRHEINGLMRGDAAARGAFYSQLFNIGAVCANDIRRLEDMEPIDDPAADKHFVQGALVPIGDAGKAQLAAATKPAVPPPADQQKPPEPPPKAEAPVVLNLTMAGDKAEAHRRSYSIVRDPKTNLITHIDTQEKK
jgi:HK97 family phage portal protein